MRRAAAALATLLATGAWAQAPAHTARVALDPGAPGPVLPLELFGINSNWQHAGGGLLEFGEMIRDRSFRNQDSPAARAWIESPNDQTGGRVMLEKSGGDDRPWGGKGYPGHMVLSQKSPGYTCISQQPTDGTVQGARYEMHLSARAQDKPAALAAFFSDEKFMPTERADRFVAVAPGAWADYRFTLEPGRTNAVSMVRVCLVSAGSVAIDEVRLQRLDGAPRVREAVVARLDVLRPRSLRWPAGSDADFFSWRESVGPMRVRGENPSAFGVFQTPAWGLHEFLDLCEQRSMVPLLTVNLREPPRSAADLVEYVLGPKESPMGALRVANGRAQPWKVTHFELGNEPAEYYQGSLPKEDTARGYVELARPVAAAMRERATALGRRIELKGALETTFARADWLKAVPMLQRWNPTVLDPRSGLVKSIDQVHGHFYSAFTYRDSAREQFEEVMAGGATLAATVRGLAQSNGPLPPFWLTEYSVMVERKKTFFRPSKILLERSRDYQAAMAAADLLMTAIQEGYAGAHLYNLAEWGTWGVLANYTDFRLRPAGYAFAMLSPLAGEQRLAVATTGGRRVSVKGADGNNPAGTTFNTLAAVAARGKGTVQVVLLNRSFDTAEKVWIDLAGTTPRAARIERLGPAAPDAINDEKADTVVPRVEEAALKGPHVVDLPARSLARIVYTLP